ncbi:hypothetical protein TUM12370_12910 [Salmonella enterica subsp. enterica serovar Choleraesuis]|nr:hypothetical protein TUM12370_12910 [Salmonella enterica subsp. enterica serovar Choleraesuis]
MRLNINILNGTFLLGTLIFTSLLYSLTLINIDTFYLISVLSVIVVLVLRKKIDLKVLFFIALLVFILGRGVLGAVGYNDSFSIMWGKGYDLNILDDKQSILFFWAMSLYVIFIAFYFFDASNKNNNVINNEAIINKKFYHYVFNICFVISLILIPISSYSKISAFLSGGYSGLYVGQTEYNFSFMRLITFLMPLMFSICLILNSSKLNKKFIFALFLFLLASLVVGQRGAFGSWMLVYLWYIIVFKRKKNAFLKLCIIGGICIPLFQFLEAYRSGFDVNQNILFSFFNNQGMTFFIPYFYKVVGNAPVSTIIASIFPVGGIFQILSLTSPETATISSWVSSGLSSNLFEQGYGVGSSIFVELFALSGNNMIVYCLLLFSMFSIIQVISNKSRQEVFFLLIFGQILPYIFLMPRGSLNQITSQIIYSSIIIFLLKISYIFVVRKRALK